MKAGDPARAPRLVRIPRDLVHIRLDDLERRGVPRRARAGLVALLADVAVLFVAGLRTPPPGASCALLVVRLAAGRATFVSAVQPDAALTGWRVVSLDERG